MLKWTKKILGILLGVLMIAVSVNMFLGPHSIAAGGLTGFALIMESITDIDRSIYVMVFNVLILILTFLMLGQGDIFQYGYRRLGTADCIEICTTYYSNRGCDAVCHSWEHTVRGGGYIAI